MKKLYTPGPVPIHKHILKIGASQAPYNRTSHFSNFTFQILEGLRYIFQTKGKVAILTASGTAAMEATVANFCAVNDNILVVNGGTFGERWCDLCSVYSLPYQELTLEPGTNIHLEDLERQFAEHHINKLLINAHETSTGILYEMEKIGKLAKKYDVFLIVDAISTVCADPYYMDNWGIDVSILSSQKALALPPGLSFIAMSEKAQALLNINKPATLYFRLKDYLNNQERGQMPYTPAISLFLQLHQRLLDIRKQTLEGLIEHHQQYAASFRYGLKSLPLEVLPERSSNAMTAVSAVEINIPRLIHQLDEQYNMMVTPNAGNLKNKVFRVSHMGNQTIADGKLLLSALRECIEL